MDVGYATSNASTMVKPANPLGETSARLAGQLAGISESVQRISDKLFGAVPREAGSSQGIKAAGAIQYSLDDAAVSAARISSELERIENRL